MGKVYFYNSKRQKLAGVFHNQGDKGVIVSHGFASNKENVSMYTEFLQSKGYSTLAFDYSGHGESAGVLAETSAAKWEDDLNSAIDFMKQRCNKLALLGFSLGGMSSLLCSGRSDATVAIAPPTNFRKLAMHFIKSGLIKEFGKKKLQRKIFKQDILRFLQRPKPSCMNYINMFLLTILLKQQTEI